MKYTLTLEHQPNEDIDGGYWQTPSAPPLAFVNVNSLREAKELFEAWREVCDSHDTFDAIHEPKRTIPAEKPTASFTEAQLKTLAVKGESTRRNYDDAMVEDLAKTHAHTLTERDKAQAHADKLAEALRDVMTVAWHEDANDDAVEAAVANGQQALAAYEEGKQ